MTLPQEALAAPDSNRSANNADPLDPNDLICPAARIFDDARVLEQIDEAIGDASTSQEIRSAAVQVLQDVQKNGRDTIEAAFDKDPWAARKLVHSYAWLTDKLVTTALKVTLKYMHPQYGSTTSERLSVIAVGGYGRAEMAPHSDVDLLFLLPYKVTGKSESIVETILYMLWDLRLKVGHSTRTIRDCLRLGREDYTIRTALLEHRPLAGDPDLAKELFDRLRDELFHDTGRDFIEAKLTERSERHIKQGGQRYMLEPNIKEGKGGLRDLQSLFWIAKYVHHVSKTEELVGLGVFTAEEYKAFEQAENFLWAVRAHLHLISGRAMDQLTFDMQVDVAKRLGYKDRAGRRDVEHFMQDYFRHATMVGELTRIFLTSLEASHAKRQPKLIGFLRRRKRLKPGYVENQGRLAIEDDTAFLADKLNLLRIFDEGLRTGMLIHPNAMRLVSANLDLIDKDMRSDKEAARIFLDLMIKHGNPERALRRMNELGVLAAFIPEFEPIVAMMQFNVYHSYTVDEHTIQCIKTLAEIEHEELVEELPIASKILKDGVNRKVLYVAMLLHDIGKGRPEDHSILGAKIARSIVPRLHLKQQERETVEWLVRYHLLMSDMAQKRDLSDPRTVRSFAKAVKTRKRLDLLTVLTVCDIRGVGPNVWNNWKAVLLRNLYRQTAEALENGLEDINRENRGTEAKKALRARLKDWTPAEIRTELNRHYDPYWQGLPTVTHEVIARLLKGIPSDKIRSELTQDTDRDATRACFAMADHPGIFSRLAGALALVGANVVDARTYTSKDGFATAVFWIQDADGAPYESARLPRLRKMIDRTLGGEVLASKELQSRDKMKKRERQFRFPTSVTFDNEGSDIYTIIEVDTRDRPGLLFDLTRSLAKANIYIASAVIATYGAQAVDVFYVKDMFGLKIHSKSKQAALEKRLTKSVADGAERANT